MSNDSYLKRKERAREKASEWQADFDNHSYSQSELVEWHIYFTKLGTRFGLIKEFRENGII